MDIKSLVNAAIERAVAEVIAEQFAEQRTVGTATVAARDHATAERVSAVVRDAQRTEKRGRTPNPTRGYFAVDATMGKRGGTKLPDMRGNNLTVLQDVIRHPGSTNRQITERTGLKRKAVESSLTMLRWLGADGEPAMQRNPKTGQYERIARRKPLIESRPLSE
jgi:hypothetical protein